MPLEARYSEETLVEIGLVSSFPSTLCVSLPKSNWSRKQTFCWQYVLSGMMPKTR